MQLSEFRDLLANDGFAATFQTMGQYRTELLRALDGLRAQADAQADAQPVFTQEVQPYPFSEWDDEKLERIANSLVAIAKIVKDDRDILLAATCLRRLIGLPKASAQGLSDDVIREVFLANGFTIKEGQPDLKPYVFAAARALLTRASAATCKTCNDQGMIGGPTYYAPDEGGVPCPDCASAATVAEPSEDAKRLEHIVAIGWEGLRKAWERFGEDHDSETALDEIRAVIDADRARPQAAQQQAEPHPSQAHSTFQTVSAPNGPGTPSAQTFDRRIACKPGRPEWKPCEQQAEPSGGTPDTYPARLLHESDKSLAWRVDSWHERHPQAAQQQAEPVGDVAVGPNGEQYFSPAKTYAEAEEAECVSMWLDKKGAPKGDTNGPFSLVGRIQALFAESQSDLQAVSAQDERAEFEAYAARNLYNCTCDVYGGYMYQTTRTAWGAWQACAAQSGQRAGVAELREIADNIVQNAETQPKTDWGKGYRQACTDIAGGLRLRANAAAPTPAAQGGV